MWDTNRIWWKRKHSGKEKKYGTKYENNWESCRVVLMLTEHDNITAEKLQNKENNWFEILAELYNKIWKRKYYKLGNYNSYTVHSNLARASSHKHNHLVGTFKNVQDEGFKLFKVERERERERKYYYYYYYLYPVLPFRVSGIVLFIHAQTLPILSCFALPYLPPSM